MNQAIYEKLRLEATERDARGIEHHHIETFLKEEGADEHTISLILGEIKTIYRIRRKKRGFKLVFIGSFLLVFGFVITLFLFHSSVSINYSMYGLTMIGIVLLLWGMVDLMGW
jgi:hypothetical protein